MNKNVEIILTILLILVSLCLTIIILVQQGRDAGFGNRDDLQKNTYWGKNKKHSMEGRLILFTRLLGAAFLILSGILCMLQ